VKQITPPVCDRCHKLLHHQTGASIHHPSIESIQDAISESPHKYNHIYHVIDAADFPMSLIPGLHRLLHLTPQRSLNRRAKTGKFYHGRRTDVSFIITRSDLLAPLKNQVDSLMPYLVSILRDALGSFGKNVRLGNVRCVSAKRGWWTKELKEDIWNRGGGGWMVGKVNVGKSQLFENVFPKGRRGTVQVDHPLLTVAGGEPPPPAANSEISAPIQTVHEIERSDWVGRIQENNALHTSSLLPPLQPEMDYPAMPIVSPLPGTTASPIRISFGNGKGELVDLPGLSRGELELYVQEPHRSSLVMRSRITPEQQVLKPGQSLLLGGFIRITPTTTDTIILAYAFTPLSPHLTSTDKAIGIQTQAQESGVENVANPGVGAIIKSAGKFSLKWDVTKQRSGPVTASDGFGIKVDRLPYRVLSTDILIEGCGWVELVAQVRKKTTESNNSNVDAHWPEVEVFSPKGAFVGSRRSLGAWFLGGQKKPATKMKGRPRKSMKGVKKKMKALKRIAES
jgi:genetic interactor of prohibitins 3, mitochondrial